MAIPPTSRGRAKAERTDALLRAAAALFAERGFSGVSLEDIGAAVGVSGPAVYRHFAGKRALLGALLIDVSRSLIDEGTQVADAAEDDEARMHALIAFHVAFALGHATVIRVHDRELAHLTDDARGTVRELQRAYVDLWITALRPLVTAGAEDLRLRVQAAFGLINSTPHSTRTTTRSQARTARTLERMAYAALTV